MKDFWIAWNSMVLVLEDEKNCRIAIKGVGYRILRNPCFIA
jgi:hypothetical protein